MGTLSVWPATSSCKFFKPLSVCNTGARAALSSSLKSGLNDPNFGASSGLCAFLSAGTIASNADVSATGVR